MRARSESTAGFAVNLTKRLGVRASRVAYRPMPLLIGCIISSVTLWAAVGCTPVGPSDDQDATSRPVEPEEYDVDIVGDGRVSQSLTARLVTLTAIPDPGWHFAGWFGDVESELNPLQIDADAVSSIGVRFEADEDVAPALDSDGDGVVDAVDACAATPGDLFVDDSGCAASQRDIDADGVPDDVDQCADTLADSVVDGDGCAATQRDGDGDSVVDSDDSCPVTPTGETVDDQGCSAGQRDSDGDGVADDVDQCADTSAGSVVDGDGCSAAQRDSDGDGVNDQVDECEDTPAAAVVDSVGCEIPPAADADGDGVSDDVDQCPGTLAGSAVDDNGCDASQRDTDGDGVADSVDACLFTPDDVAVDATGCRLPVCGNGDVESGETCDPPSCNVCDTNCQTIDALGTPTWSVLDVNGADETQTGALSGVWGSGPDDVFTVGGTDVQGEAYHFDGTSWSTMTVPVGKKLLIWVFGFGPSDVYAVGLGGAVLHYDGNASLEWTAQDSGVDVNLWGIWGSSPSDMWMVGGDAFGGDPLILHYDGVQNGTFTPTPVPTIDRTNAHALFKVWGIGSKVFAVGQQGLILEHASGTWSQMESGTTDDLISLWGTSETNVVAVGGRAFGRITHYDGASWDATVETGMQGLNAVYMAQPDEALIGGINGTVFTYDPGTQAAASEASNTLQTIHAIWMDCYGKAYAVGGMFNPPFSGIALMRSLDN